MGSTLLPVLEPKDPFCPQCDIRGRGMSEPTVLSYLLWLLKAPPGYFRVPSLQQVPPEIEHKKNQPPVRCPMGHLKSQAQIPASLSGESTQMVPHWAQKQPAQPGTIDKGQGGQWEQSSPVPARNAIKQTVQIPHTSCTSCWEEKGSQKGCSHGRGWAVGLRSN